MRKGDLIAAIKENQSGGAAVKTAAVSGKATTKRTDAKGKGDSASTGGESASTDAAPAKAETTAKVENTSAKTEAPAAKAEDVRVKAEVPSYNAVPVQEKSAEPREAKREEAEGNRTEGGDESRDRGERGRGRQRRGREQRGAASTGNANASAGNAGGEANAAVASESSAEKSDSEGGDRRRDRNNQQSGGQNQQSQNGTARGNNNDRDRGDRNNRGPDRGPAVAADDDEEGGRGRRGRRFRERRRGRDREGVPGETTSSRESRELEIREDDVLQPVAGILDVLDNYAFVRTSGYLAGPNDVYVSMNLVRKNGLRRGDAVTGAVRAARDGDQSNQRQKFDPLVRLDTINGSDIESAKRRPEFNKLTPLYPNQRLRLETQPNKLTTRIIDLIMPIGKGQRALIVSPPKAGKTTIMQDIANAIAVNNPECYLMVVLVDERPEEVTDMQRSVRGEVIASTFDRPPGDHTAVAELAIERAKRLVEMGQDVVVLLDSITRLGRAYNNSSPASGRILSGGVDSTALYPPKRFLGAARNIENGGSLTIIATAMVETGSTGDTVIFEEFKGTGNAELKLDRKIAERRVFPAVDVNPSGTRRDDLLMSPDEAAVLHKLRRVLSGLDSHQAIDLLVDRLKKTKSNAEFLMTVSKTAPGAMDE